MRRIAWLNRTVFELADGRILRCEWVQLPHWYADSDEPGDPAYTLDGYPVTLDELPKGLEAVAIRMYLTPRHYSYTKIQS